MSSLTHRGHGPVTGWRASSHSTTSQPPACLEVAPGYLISGTDGGSRFVIDSPTRSARPSPTPMTAARPPVITTRQTAPPAAPPAAPPGSAHATRDIRPRLVGSDDEPVPARAWAGHRRLPRDVVRSSYPWLSKINPLYSQSGDFATNCVLAAIGTDLTLREAMLEPDEDPALRPYYQVPPSEHAPREHIRNLGKGEPIAVPGYAAITDAMIHAGRGARGIVIAGVEGEPIGHVFNVVHDENGVVFLDGQRGRQAILPERFQSLEFLPTSDGFPNDSIAVTTTPGRPPQLLGAYGLEFETAIVVHGLPPDVAESGLVLAENKRLGYQVKIDLRPFPRDTEGTYYRSTHHFERSHKRLADWRPQPIVEFVSMPLGATEQPQDIRTGDRVTVIASIRDKLDTLQREVAARPGRRPRLPARTLFPPSEGWELLSAQKDAEPVPEWAADRTTFELLPITAPGSGAPVLYPQYTAGVPLSEMHEFLRYALTNVPHEDAKPRLQDGLLFGDELAQRFVRWRLGASVPKTDLDLLGEIESVSAVRGMAALLYPHIIALMDYYLYPRLIKGSLVAASRVALAGIRQQLPADARTFLETNAQRVRDSLLDRYRSGRPDYELGFDVWSRRHGHVRPARMSARDPRIDLLRLPIPEVAEGITIGDYLDNILLGRPSRHVDQFTAIGMGTQFDAADTNEGRLAVPLIPVELRAFGPPSGTDIHHAEAALASIDDVLGPMYHRAQRRRVASVPEPLTVWFEERRDTLAAGQERLLNALSVKVAWYAALVLASGNRLAVRVTGFGNGRAGLSREEHARATGSRRAHHVLTKLRAATREVSGPMPHAIGDVSFVAATAGRGSGEDKRSRRRVDIEFSVEPAPPAGGSLPAIDWQESSHSNGQACVSIAVVDPGAGATDHLSDDIYNQMASRQTQGRAGGDR
jgi:Papain fold toxin 1, glutamine deamidase